VLRRVHLRHLLELAGLSILLGAAVNAVSPRGISWSRPLGEALRARAVEAGLVPVDLASVRERLRDGRALFVDARPPEEFEVGALPGAVPVPWREVEAGRVPGGLPGPDRPLVLYCANEFCESSLELGRWLKKRGHRDVALFVEGYEAWWSVDGIHGAR
jgi:ArsR family transcriptional regulator